MSGQRSRGSTFCVHAACIRGVEAVPVTVEVSMGGGIPGISIVGLAESTVTESRVRIRCALGACGYEVPRRSIVVNLAPGDLRKAGTGFDLPIAVAILALSGQIPTAGIDDKLFVGEVGLDGSILQTKGEVAYALLARDTGLELVCAHAAGGMGVSGVRHRWLESIGALARGIEQALRPCHDLAAPAHDGRDALDFSDVIGQDMAKRALSIAACGGLGMLMVGPPGSGKSMLAKRYTSILPAMDERLQQEALCVHSVAGSDVSELLCGIRPFRSPHHSISTAGLVGGGRPVHPGEVSLAHGGVLFLDELAEFPSSVLQSLRQPMEDRVIHIVRVDGAYVFPADFQFLAASNPCPCGYLGDPSVGCTCSVSAIQRYQGKLGGPLGDRIDIAVDVSRPDPELIVAGARGMSSSELKANVVEGRAFKAWRERRGGVDLEPDAPRSVEGAVGYFHLDAECERTLLDIARRANLSGRGIHRICRVARTIADMDASELIGRKHMLEASLYRGRMTDAT